VTQVAPFSVDDCPCELACAIREFWPEEEWDNAASVAKLESGWDAFAVADTRDSQHPCGTVLRSVDGVDVSAEYSLGYFQLNACNFPDWPAERFFNARHNAGTAHLLWSGRGWQPWYFSAKQLGLLP
jgi:hypothetical protein